MDASIGGWTEDTVSEKTSSETVRKTPSGSELNPQKSTKQVEEGLFRYSEDLKWRLQRLL
jgi:hypothetical protein